MSGAKSRRPGLDRLMDDARLHRFDVIVVWKLDRFGRSVIDLVSRLRDLESYGVRFVAASQRIDTDASDPTSRLLPVRSKYSKVLKRWVISSRAERLPDDVTRQM